MVAAIKKQQWKVRHVASREESEEMELVPASGDPLKFVWQKERGHGWSCGDLVCRQHNGRGKDSASIGEVNSTGRFDAPWAAHTEMPNGGIPLSSYDIDERVSYPEGYEWSLAGNSRDVRRAFLAVSGMYGEQVCRTCAIAFMVNLAQELNVNTGVSRLEPVDQDDAPLRRYDASNAEVLRLWRAGETMETLHAQVGYGYKMLEEIISETEEGERELKEQQRLAEVEAAIAERRAAEQAQIEAWHHQAYEQRFMLYYASKRNVTFRGVTMDDDNGDPVEFMDEVQRNGMPLAPLAYRTGLPVSAIDWAIDVAAVELYPTAIAVLRRIRSGVWEVEQELEDRRTQTAEWYLENQERLAREAAEREEAQRLLEEQQRIAADKALIKQFNQQKRAKAKANRELAAKLQMSLF